MPFSIAGPSSPAIPSLDGINRVAQRISSGISVDFRSNAAESAIAGRIDSSLGETTVSIKNITDQVSSLQKADDTLGYVSNLLERAQALEVKANSGALSDTDRDIIQRSQTNLLQEAQSTLENARFNEQPLFTDQAGSAVQDKLAQSNPNFSEIRDDLTSQRADIGAKQNGLASQANQLLDQQIIASGQLSQIQDTDFAEEIANLIKEELQFKASVMVFDRQRVAEEAVLGLLTQ
ncbi:MAG: flagellin [Candidatus Pseudothioglobus sp.]|jgi:flagellin